MELLQTLLEWLVDNGCSVINPPTAIGDLTRPFTAIVHGASVQIQFRGDSVRLFSPQHIEWLDVLLADPAAFLKLEANLKRVAKESIAIATSASRRLKQ